MTSVTEALSLLSMSDSVTIANDVQRRGLVIVVVVEGMAEQRFIDDREIRNRGSGADQLLSRIIIEMIESCRRGSSHRNRRGMPYPGSEQERFFRVESRYDAAFGVGRATNVNPGRFVASNGIKAPHDVKAGEMVMVDCEETPKDDIKALQAEYAKHVKTSEPTSTNIITGKDK